MKLGAVSGQDKRKHLKFWGMTFQLLFSEKAGAEIHLHTSASNGARGCSPFPRDGKKEVGLQRLSHPERGI